MKKSFCLLLVLGILSNCFCQNTSIADSLLQLLSNKDSKSNRPSLLSQLGHAYKRDGQVEKSDSCFLLAIEGASKTKDEITLMKSFSGLGDNERNRNKLGEAIAYYDKGIEAGKNSKDGMVLSRLYYGKGLVFHDHGQYPKALDNNFTVLEMLRPIANQNDAKLQKFLGDVYSEIGIIYGKLNEFNTALPYMHKSLEYRKRLGNDQQIAMGLVNLATTMEKANKVDSALKIYNEALVVVNRMGNIYGKALIKNNLAGLYYKSEKTKEALLAHQEALDLWTSIGDKGGMALGTFNVATVLYNQKNFPKAIEYGKKSLSLAKELNSLYDLSQAYEVLYKSYEGTGNKIVAFDYLKLYYSSRDSLTNEDKKSEMASRAMQYEYKQKQFADSVKLSEERLLAQMKVKEIQIINNEKQKRQLFIIYGVASILILVIVFSAFLYKRYKLTQKQKSIIEEKERVTQKQNEEILKQKNVIEQKQEEILDSIRYAKRIQSALVTSEMYFHRELKRLKI